MKHKATLLGLCVALVAALTQDAAAQTPHRGLRRDALQAGFAVPPPQARLRAYWWWLNGNVTKASIKNDLDEMAAKGFGGAVIFDANGSSQDYNTPVPHGATFGSPQWRELYRYTLQEAHRLGLEISLNIQSGWNLGGPMVRAEDAPKKLTWSEQRVSAPGVTNAVLPEPTHAAAFYRDIAVVAYPVKPGPAGGAPATLQNWQEKALEKELPFSAPDTSGLLRDPADTPGEEATRARDVVDLTGKMDADGRLRWQAPPGEWTVMRFGCTLNDSPMVSTASDGWQGYAIDTFDAGAFRSYWQSVVEPLIADAGPLAGGTLRYLHTDSWETGVANWTPTLAVEFRARRGYDLRPFLPVMAGRIVDSRTVSDRFLNDLRRTLGDLAIANHYRPFQALSRRHGLLLHPESGGPHAVPIDSLQCLGMDDAPMSEFWARANTHRITEEERFFVKQPASAAHTYGHPLVVAEGFTNIGLHWQESLWSNLKPTFDQACCEGLNRLVWHAFVCSPAETGVPGQQYFAGTHLNPKTTWWGQSAPFFSYLNRCQFLLQQGRFVADALYYYGDQVPNFTQLKRSDPAHVLPGYDYDVATEEVLLRRLQVRDGRLVLPDGMRYRVLVLPDRPAISLPVLRKVRQLVQAGATVIGPKPSAATTLQGYPGCDDEVRRLADALWGSGAVPSVGDRHVGAGRVVWGQTARAVLGAGGVPPDFQCQVADPTAALDYIHRQAGATDIYFVASRAESATTADCAFRVTHKVPELWDPVTGITRPLTSWHEAGGRTHVSLRFAPYGSWFLVFRRPSAAPAISALRPNFPPPAPPAGGIGGPWTVRFDPKWGGPPSAVFPALVDWTTRPEPGIHYYSGTATYLTRFDLPPAARGESPAGFTLDLGEVKELAQVVVNGKNCGIVWAPPFRVPLPNLKPTGNTLEVRVTNFWSNRVIGDEPLPAAQRLTRTNIRRLTAQTPLLPSGLLGPVRLYPRRP